LTMDNKLALAGVTRYTYQIKGQRYKSEKKTTRRPEIVMDRASLGAAMEHSSADAPIEITIWTNRQTASSDPVRVYFDWSPNRDASRIRRISRG